MVDQVQQGSPADVAGLQEGDVITSFDGKSITSADQLASDIQGDKPGQSVKIGLWRGQQQLTVTATLASASQEQQQRRRLRSSGARIRPDGGGHALRSS